MRRLGNARMRAKYARAHERRGCNGAEFRSYTRHGHDPDGNTDHRGARAPRPVPTNRGRIQANERYEAIYVGTDHVGDESRVRQISGAAVWSGLAVGLATWVLLELLLAAVDLVPLGLSGAGYDTSELWWTGGASVIALLLGGLVAGAAARSPGLRPHPGRSGGVCGRRRTVPRSDGVRSGCRWRPRCGDVGVVREQRP